jgi:hypothetical protein
MQVMRVWHVRMTVTQGLVPMPVTVLARRHRFVCVLMVPIVVRVRMLVLHRLVRMVVGMRLREMQGYTGQHQGATRSQAHAERSIAHGDREQRADEGREREHRPGPRRAAPNARWESKYRRRLSP